MPPEAALLCAPRYASIHIEKTRWPSARCMGGMQRRTPPTGGAGGGC